MRESARLAFVHSFINSRRHGRGGPSARFFSLEALFSLSGSAPTSGRIVFGCAHRDEELYGESEMKGMAFTLCGWDLLNDGNGNRLFFIERYEILVVRLNIL